MKFLPKIVFHGFEIIHSKSNISTHIRVFVSILKHVRKNLKNTYLLYILSYIFKVASKCKEIFILIFHIFTYFFHFCITLEPPAYMLQKKWRNISSHVNLTWLISWMQRKNSHARIRIGYYYDSWFVTVT